MAEGKSKVDYSVLTTLTAPWQVTVAETAKIGKDTSKGIADDVDVPFTNVVFNIQDGATAKEVWEALGSKVFNGLINYGADLKLRSRAVQAKRAEFSADPLKKEAKMVSSLFGEEFVGQYRELRAAGHSSKDACAQLG